LFFDIGCSLTEFSFKEEPMRTPISPETIDSIRTASKLLTSVQRRRFQAEMALKYCDGSPRVAEDTFGWRRTTVETGLGELRSGILCLDNSKARGRKKSEVLQPSMEQRIRDLAESQAQVDPKFQTDLTFTRITAQRVRDELLKDEQFATNVPTRQTIGTMLNRFGFSLKRVQKTRPKKDRRNRCNLRKRCTPTPLSLAAT
jgi:transposase